MPKKESEPRDAAMMLVQQIRDGKPLAIYGADSITESEAAALRQHPNLDEHLVRFVIQKRKETADRKEREQKDRQAREALDRAERERKHTAVDVVRISIDEKRKEQRGSLGHSKDTQHAINQEKMQRLGYDLAREYGAAFVVDRIPTTEPKPLSKNYPGAFVDDGGPSWAVSERLRPALWSLILRLHEKRIKIDAVFVYEPGRLARDPDLFGKLYRLFTKGLGVELVIEGQPVNDENLGGIDRILRNVKAFQGGTLEDVLIPHRPRRDARIALYKTLEMADRDEFDAWFKVNYPKLFYRVN